MGNCDDECGPKKHGYGEKSDHPKSNPVYSHSSSAPLLSHSNLFDLNDKDRALFVELFKKTPANKLKALAKIKKKILDSNKFAHVILGPWLQSFKRLCRYPVDDVRRSVAGIHLHIVKIAKREFLIYLNEFIGYWLCSQYDPINEIAKIFAESLKEAFPSKLHKIFEFYKDQIATHIITELSVNSPKSPAESFELDNSQALSKTEPDEIRLYSVVSLLKNIIDLDRFNDISTLEKVLRYEGLWDGNRYKTTKTRNIWYEFIISATKKVPSTIKPVIESIPTDYLLPILHVEKFQNYVINWKVAISIISVSPDVWVKNHSLKNALLDQLSSGIMFDSNIVRNSLYELLMKLPTSISEKTEFRLNILSSIWSGFSNTSPHYINGENFINLYLNLILLYCNSLPDNQLSYYIDPIFKPIKLCLLVNTFPKMFSCIKYEYIHSYIQGILYNFKDSANDIICESITNEVKLICEEALLPHNIQGSVFEKKYLSISGNMRNFILQFKNPQHYNRMYSIFCDLYFGIIKHAKYNAHPSHFQFLKNSIWLLLERPQLINDNLSSLKDFFGLSSSETSYPDSECPTVDKIPPNSDYCCVGITIALCSPEEMKDFKISLWCEIFKQVKLISTLNLCNVLDYCFDMCKSFQLNDLPRSIFDEQIMFILNEIVNEPDSPDKLTEFLAKYFLEDSFISDKLIKEKIIQFIFEKISEVESLEDERLKECVVNLYISILNGISLKVLNDYMTLFTLTFKTFLAKLLIVPRTRQYKYQENSFNNWSAFEKLRENNKGEVVKILIDVNMEYVVDLVFNHGNERGKPLEFLENVFYIISEDKKLSTKLIKMLAGNPVAHWREPGDILFTELYIGNQCKSELLYNFDVKCEESVPYSIMKTIQQFILRYFLIAKISESAAFLPYLLTIDWIGTELFKVNYLLSEICASETINMKHPELRKLAEIIESNTKNILFTSITLIGIEDDILLTALDGKLNPDSDRHLSYLPNLVSNSLDAIGNGHYGYNHILLEVNKTILDREKSMDPIYTALKILKKYVGSNCIIIHRKKLALAYCLIVVSKFSEEDIIEIAKVVELHIRSDSLDSKVKCMYNTFINRIIEFNLGLLCDLGIFENKLITNSYGNICEDDDFIKTYINKDFHSSLNDEDTNNELLNSLIQIIHISYNIQTKNNSDDSIESIVQYSESMWLLTTLVIAFGKNLDYKLFIYAKHVLDIVMKFKNIIESWHKMILLRECLKVVTLVPNTEEIFDVKIVFLKMTNSDLRNCNYIPVLNEIDILLCRFMKSEIIYTETFNKATISMCTDITCSELFYSKLLAICNFLNLISKNMNSKSVSFQILAEDSGNIDTIIENNKEFEDIDISKTIVPIFLNLEKRNSLELNTRASCIILCLLLLSHIKYATPKLRLYYLSVINKYGLIDFIMPIISDILSQSKNNNKNFYHLEPDIFPENFQDKPKDKILEMIASHAYFLLTDFLPELIAMWHEKEKGLPSVKDIRAFTSKHISLKLYNKLLSQITQAQAIDNNAKIDTSNGRSARNIFVQFDIDGCEFSLIFDIPFIYPLQRISVETDSPNKKRVINSKKVQKVAILPRQSRFANKNFSSMLNNVDKMVRTYNNHIDEALKLLVKNVKNYIEGVQACSICFNTVDTPFMSLPTKICRTCTMGFHGNCLSEWFKSSNGTSCPICRQPF